MHIKIFSSLLLAGGAVLLVAPFGPDSAAMAQPDCGAGMEAIPTPGGGWTCGGREAWQPSRSDLGSWRPAPLPDWPPPPPSHRIDSYVVIAWHPNAKGVWATWDQRTAAAGEKIVLRACEGTMGEGCTIATAIVNGTVVVGTDQTGRNYFGAAATEIEAKQELARQCRKTNVVCSEIKSYSSGVLKDLDSWSDSDKASVDAVQRRQGYAFPSFSKILPPRPAAGIAGMDDAPPGMRLIHSSNIGRWVAPEAGPKGAHKCAVMFMAEKSSRETMILFGPSGPTNGGMSFVGPRIPKVREPRQVQLTMRLAEGSFPTPAMLAPTNGKDGMLMIPVKMADTLRNMQDSGPIEFILDSKTIYSVRFDGGLKARDALSGCMNH